MNDVRWKGIPYWRNFICEKIPGYFGLKTLCFNLCPLVLVLLSLAPSNNFSNLILLKSFIILNTSFNGLLSHLFLKKVNFSFRSPSHDLLHSSWINLELCVEFSLVYLCALKETWPKMQNILKLGTYYAVDLYFGITLSFLLYLKFYVISKMFGSPAELYIFF